MTSAGFVLVNGQRVPLTARAIGNLGADAPACGGPPFSLKGGGPGQLWFERPVGRGEGELLRVNGAMRTLANLAPATKALVEAEPGKWVIGIVEAEITDGNQAAATERGQDNE